jgi:hypothetical protein
MLGRGARRLSVVLALGLLPIAAIAWMGCGDDDAAVVSGLGKADPGGTWGAQVAVTVVGRGKVSAPGVLDCPNSCFSTLVFPNNAADGAMGGITLTAEPNAGGKFLGWAFEPTPLGGGGRGPDTCNPVMRAATLPSVDPNALQITLPYGEVDGTSPPGHEAECASFKRVPLAYKVVANFTGEIPEAGPDVLDGGNPDAEGGNPGDPVVYNITNGTSPTLLGRTSSGYIYWTFSSGGFVGLSVGTSPESSFVPQTAQTVASSLDSITRSKVEPNGVVLLDIFGDLKAVRQSSPTSLINVGSTSGLGTCQALAMDTGSNVHCRLSTSIATWKWNGSSYDSPTQVFVNLPSGQDLAVDTSNFYYSTTTTIESVPLNGTDASAPTQVISGTSSVSRLVAGSAKLTWQSNNTVELSSSKTSSSSFGSSGITQSLTGTLFGLAFDPFDSYTVYAGGTYGIYRYPSAGTPQEVKTGGKTFTGMAVGGNYVFYTASGENKIYRIAKPF